LSSLRVLALHAACELPDLSLVRTKIETILGIGTGCCGPISRLEHPILPLEKHHLQVADRKERTRFASLTTCILRRKRISPSPVQHPACYLSPPYPTSKTAHASHALHAPWHVRTNLVTGREQHEVLDEQHGGGAGRTATCEAEARAAHRRRAHLWTRKGHRKGTERVHM